MIVFGFPGQWSQLKGMGSDVFKKFEKYTNVANEILGYSI
jgi:trans-AT polyketide synthase, acyltransferase and oxidoreductase domains